MTTIEAMAKARFVALGPELCNWSYGPTNWDDLSEETRVTEITAMRAALATALTNAPRLHDLADTYHRAITAILAEETT